MQKVKIAAAHVTSSLASSNPIAAHPVAAKVSIKALYLKLKHFFKTIPFLPSGACCTEIEDTIESTELQ